MYATKHHPHLASKFNNCLKRINNIFAPLKRELAKRNLLNNWTTDLGSYSIDRFY